MSNKVIITQSNYIPWKGYFSTMREATHLVLYDHAQYTKRDWRNRNKIITPNGPKWLSIPVSVKGKYYQKINETEVNNLNWAKNHWNLIKINYKNSPYFNTYSPIFEELYSNPSTNLSEINRSFIEAIIKILGIDIEISYSSEYSMQEGKTKALVNICKELNAEKYFTGPAAKNYMDENLFTHNNIEIEYYNFSGYPEYKQQWDGFDHAVSILDMFFNLGPETIKYFN